VTDKASPNYPDLLGAVTGGARFTLDFVQCALALDPPQVAAGRFIELVLLLQNASDIDIDVVAAPDLPQRDLNNNRGRFATKSARLRIGLRPAEVGYLRLPVSTSPTTAPGPGYTMGMALDIKRLGKHPQRIRAEAGGGPFAVQELPELTQQHLETLRALRFSVDSGSKKHIIQAPFEVLPPAVSPLRELKPDWSSLWTMRDYMDDYAIAQKVWPHVESVLPKLHRETIFMPLLKSTQDRFNACGYPLMPPEAIYITKLLTLILEMGIQEPTPAEPQPPWPRWFARMCRLLFQEPALAAQVEPLVSRVLYPDLIYDAILYAFSSISIVTNESFGAPDEAASYAQRVVAALIDETPLGFDQTYFPLVLGGLIANTRITMPREQPRETVFILSKALDNRRAERNDDNHFVFEIAGQLVERALDMTG
jgi:hypothetical protein